MSTRISMRKPRGVILVDGAEKADTAMCCHCNAHFVMIAGSGKKRGYCLNCGSITCGKPECHECIPFEKKLELVEKGILKHL